ncbi:hypothetical protein C3744_28700 [Priestia megaterium]|uniref:DUF1593 domain-containing protein n=2 Tax=Priestia megaterium TaxID=1404 RepID=A0A3D8WTL6_PRIMG|nr:DUF1593 domain-containing protein [Priestia megaterium]MDH3168880.1 DUF1593 domain-containing protein [Priestia megaterium]RDZ06407.1 hypothetical protein C3744_28700 [Priestia megaterium]
MKKRKLIFYVFLLFSVFFIFGCTNKNEENVSNKENYKIEKSKGSKGEKPSKARTVITTDGEVDDMNSVIRYLLYANEMDLEGIVLTSSMYHYAGDEEKGIKPYRWTGTDWLTNMLGAYEKAYPNLIKHADGYPKPDYIRSVTKIGNISNAGEMEKKTEGSEFLKDLFLDNNENDLYVQTWGGTNTTARALKSIQEEYEKSDEWEKIKKKVSDKLVLYIILDQDESYNAYIAKNWPDIRIINDQSNFWHFAYAWKNHTNEVNSKLQGDWNYQNIKNGHGTLMDLYALMGDGKIIEGELSEEQRGSEEYLKKNPQYNRYDFISEGDSPSFFYLIDNGLRSMENPTYGGWGGRFGAVNDKLYRNTVLDYDIHTKRYETEYSLMRWFDDIQNDFAARADWVIASKYDDANHNPTLKIKEGLDLNVNKGEKITLHATGKDPDGDNLTYKWWRYFEADTYEDSKVPQKETKQELLGDLLIGTHRELAEGEVTDSIKLSGSDTNTVTFTIPEDAKSGDTIHIIAEVQDDGAHGLKHYQRVILTVK